MPNVMAMLDSEKFSDSDSMEIDIDEDDFGGIASSYDKRALLKKMNEFYEE